MVDFLTDRAQRIKLADGYLSDRGSVPSGVLQGTKLFLVLINDLRECLCKSGPVDFP